jgi:hypothetical protein
MRSPIEYEDFVTAALEIAVPWISEEQFESAIRGFARSLARHLVRSGRPVFVPGVGTFAQGPAWVDENGVVQEGEVTFCAGAQFREMIHAERLAF